MTHNYLSILLFVFIITVFLSCKIDLKDEGDIAYFGGEIINPKNNRVVIYSTNEAPLDTLNLDANNRFLHKITHLKPGLYSFTHGGEYQMVLLEPNDSVMFRLNTYEFDESLVFTGKGAKKNNYLIKTYLTNETEANDLIKHSKMPPSEFMTFIEKRRQKHLKEFETFFKQTNASNFFKSIVTDNINYSAFADKEIYPFAYFGNNKMGHITDLPEDFYDYRKDVTYDANHLLNFFSYNRFLFTHFDNLALKKYYEKHSKDTTFYRYALEYNKHKLDLIDNLIPDAIIKNKLLKYKVRDFITNNRNKKEAKMLLDYYDTKTNNDAHKNDLKNLLASLQCLEKGNELPNLSIVDYYNKEYKLMDHLKKPTIIYFWSANLKSHYKNSHYKVKKLKSKFPQFDFISICINDEEDHKFWVNTIEQYKFPKENEFRFKDSKKALKALAVNYTNKAIIVDANGVIIDPNSSIYQNDFENQLAKLVKN